VQHQGKILEGVTGTWPVIFDRETFDWVTAKLNDPANRRNLGAEQRHLLSGLALCGRCGTPVRTLKGPAGSRSYTCPSCFKLRRSEAPVDTVVESYMITMLEDERVFDRLASGDPEAVREADRVIADAEAGLLVAMDKLDAGIWTEAMVDRRTAQLRQKIADAETTRRLNRRPDLPYHICGPDAETKWAEATIDQKRALISALITVRIKPVERSTGRQFNPDLIEVIEVHPAG
jgi:hypothetical protein